MEDVFEQLVAENRELRKQVKTLRARVSALESSRWWRLHPRRVLRSAARTAETDGGGRGFASAAKVQRVARSWRLKGAYEHRSAGSRPDEVAVRDGIRVRVHPETRWSFEEFCYGAPEQVEELDRFIATTQGRRRLLDVGALHGIFSLVFVAGDPARHALAIDASPVAFAKLLYNVHSNAAQSIQAVECALSATPGILEMHYDSEHAVAGAARNRAALQIETETGDDLCERCSFEPDVVKVDVEGHEVRVVEGLRATFLRNRPLLFLEVHPRLVASDPGNGSLTELVETLRTLGYIRAELQDSVVDVDALSEVVEIERVLLRPE